MTNIKRPSDYLMAQDLCDRQFCRRPMSWGGDFDDHYTAEDYDRRRYARDVQTRGYSSWDRCGR